MNFGPNQGPWAVLDGELASWSVWIVVFAETTFQVVGLADVEPTSRVFKDINPELILLLVVQTPRQGLEP